jgi:hypothetical protein
MQSEEKVIAILSEIRDIQAKHFAEYCKISSESISMQRESFKEQQQAIAQQRQSVEMQRRSVRLYKYVLLAATPVLAFLVWRLIALPI